MDESGTAAAAQLSVVVPAVNGRATLVECVAALTNAAAPDLGIEILVIDRCRATPPSWPSSRDRDVRVVVIEVPALTSIPKMREIAIQRATASAVAVIEDHVLVPPNWARQMLGALADGADVVGGSVENGATERTTDWAAFLCEYSQLLSPLRAGPVETLAGNNVVYRRAVLQRFQSAVSAGRWEDHLHAAMRNDGVTLTCRPDISVRHKMHYRVHEYIAQRFLYSRAHAGLRAAAMSGAQRAMFAVAALALPGVLLLRIVRRVTATGRFGNELLRSLPLLVVFVCAWAGGEVVGFAVGPGDALSRIR